jgi:hypothetical protein
MQPEGIEIDLDRIGLGRNVFRTVPAGQLFWLDIGGLCV